MMNGESDGCGSVRTHTNDLGMEMVRVEAGSFIMGSRGKFWDEEPAHRVTISSPFHISRTPVTVEQYSRFRPRQLSDGAGGPWALGLSWHDAEEFCRWLSDREGRSYRLPTEAEWEYVCRKYDGGPPGGGRDGDVGGMLGELREWCHDWYGEYPAGELVDPVGPDAGHARVVRGGLLDRDSGKADRRGSLRPAKRSGMAPAFGRLEGDTENDFGAHHIGFRVVQGPLPGTEPRETDPPLVTEGVRKINHYVTQSGGTDRPHIRKRYLLPTPPENRSREEIDTAGLHPSFRGHNHSPALEVCPNGDLLLIIYTSYHEYEPGVSLIASRLRFGADRWDMPSPLFCFPGANDHAPLLWNDGGTLRFFWGNPRLKGAFPFQWTSSSDSGSSWDAIEFPLFRNRVGPHSRQPINTAFRDREGTIYVSSDARGPESVLWASDDNGRSWYDTGGRTYGRHTTFVPLRDGGILGMGGKRTEIDGYMPRSISRDGGASWEVEATPFPAQQNNQRPTVLRLASGRLFFAGDFQDIHGRQPEGVAERGAYVALSEDEGDCWHIKRLPGAQPHENPERAGGQPTLGYSVARQAPDGVIHLITTMNEPSLHFALNEEWILSGEATMSEGEMRNPDRGEVRKVRKHLETYPGGGPRIRWQGGIAEDGSFVLHGREVWYYPDGSPKREASYDRGRRVGTETFWYGNGRRKWTWEHGADGRSIWRQWWPCGQKKSRSEWVDFRAEGPAVCWDRNGEVVRSGEFVNGRLVGG